MFDYQKIFVLCFVIWFLSMILVALIESVIKKHKAKKKAFAELVKENQRLEEKIYSLKFQAKLRGVNLDV